MKKKSKLNLKKVEISEPPSYDQYRINYLNAKAFEEWAEKNQLPSQS